MVTKITGFGIQGDNVNVTVSYTDFDGNEQTITRSYSSNAVIGATPEQIRDFILSKVALAKSQQVQNTINEKLEPFVGFDLEQGVPTISEPSTGGQTEPIPEEPGGDV